MRPAYAKDGQRARRPPGEPSAGTRWDLLASRLETLPRTAHLTLRRKTRYNRGAQQEGTNHHD